MSPASHTCARCGSPIGSGGPSGYKEPFFVTLRNAVGTVLAGFTLCLACHEAVIRLASGEKP